MDPNEILRQIRLGKGTPHPSARRAEGQNCLLNAGVDLADRLAGDTSASPTSRRPLPQHVPRQFQSNRK
jgi:hypothetical protein